MMRSKGRLLWVDGLGGLLAGTLVLLVSGWLSELEGLPQGFVIFMACANLLYGSYSTALARRSQRPPARIAILAVANMVWGVACFGFALWFADSITGFGLLHVVGEGVYVGGLGMVEWRWREALRTP